MVHGTPNIFFRNAENFSSQYAEAMLPKKRCLAFDFKFSIKQAFFNCKMILEAFVLKKKMYILV